MRAQYRAIHGAQGQLHAAAARQDPSERAAAMFRVEDVCQTELAEWRAPCRRLGYNVLDLCILCLLHHGPIQGLCHGSITCIHVQVCFHSNFKGSQDQRCGAGLFFSSCCKQEAELWPEAGCCAGRAQDCRANDCSDLQSTCCCGFDNHVKRGAMVAHAKRAVQVLSAGPVQCHAAIASKTVCMCATVTQAHGPTDINMNIAQDGKGEQSKTVSQSTAKTDKGAVSPPCRACLCCSCEQVCNCTRHNQTMQLCKSRHLQVGACLNFGVNACWPCMAPCCCPMYSHSNKAHTKLIGRASCTAKQRSKTARRWLRRCASEALDAQTCAWGQRSGQRTCSFKCRHATAQQPETPAALKAQASALFAQQREMQQASELRRWWTGHGADPCIYAPQKQHQL